VVADPASLEGVAGQTSQTSLGNLGKVRIIDVRMDVEGTYESLKTFLASIRRQPRLLNIRQFSFASPLVGKIFKFSIALEAYSY
jgi:hypothetical protein